MCFAIMGSDPWDLHFIPYLEDYVFTHLRFKPNRKNDDDVKTKYA